MPTMHSESPVNTYFVFIRTVYSYQLIFEILLLSWPNIAIQKSNVKVISKTTIAASSSFFVKHQMITGIKSNPTAMCVSVRCVA